MPKSEHALENLGEFMSNFTLFKSLKCFISVNLSFIDLTVSHSDVLLSCL